MRGLARYAAYCAAGLAVLVVAAALALPYLLDTPAVRAQIQRKLSGAVQGKVAWEALSVRILPRPLGVLRKARIEIPGRLEVGADELAVRLAFWPLLRGRAEVVSVTLLRPVIVLDIPEREGQDAGKEAEGERRFDLVRAYRSTAGVLSEIVQRFAPDTVLSIEDARLEFSAPGILPVALHDVAVQARTGHTGMDVQASLSGTHWRRVKLAARLQFADLSGNADIEVTGLKPQPWLDHYLAGSPVHVSIAAADARVRASTDGRTALESEFEASTGAVGVRHAAERIQVEKVGIKGKITAGSEEVVMQVADAQAGSSRITGGRLAYSFKDASLAGDIGYDVDLAQGMDSTRRLVPAPVRAVLSWFEPVTGRAQGTAKLALGHADWRVAVHVAKSDATVQIRDLPGPARLVHGEVDIDRYAVRVHRASASLPAGRLLLSTLHHAYRDHATTAAAEFDIDVAQGLEIARRFIPEKSRDALAVVQSASGRARGNTKLAFGRKGWRVDVAIAKADAQVQVRGLPGPAGVSSGSVRVEPGTVKIEGAVATLLDAKARASVTTAGAGEGLKVQGSLTEGTVGARFLDWIWRTAEAPPHLALKTPVSVTAPRFTWEQKRTLDVQATARFPAGQAVTADLGWSPGTLDVRRATLRDARSNATLALRSGGPLLEGRFSGSLHSTSIAAMLRSATVPSGGASGDFRFSFHRDKPRATTAQGTLRGEALDLAWLLRRPVRIDRIELAADGKSLAVREATIDWAGQRATVRGEVRHGPDGPVVDALLDSPGVDLDALLPNEPASERPPGPAPDPAAEKRDLSGIWPLPVTGQVAVRSGFVKRDRYRVAPFAGTVVLRERSAKVDLREAQLCGISLPLAIEATPAGILASASIAAQKQQLQETTRCLTDHNVLITGEFDLKADLTSQGALGELARNMKGSVTADLRDGRVMKFAMLGNILSMHNISSLMKADGPRLDAQGFPYRSLKLAGRFNAGRFLVDEGAFRSDAVGLAAHGWISLLEPESRLTVLVAPFSRLDDLARSVPVLGYIVGGTFTSVPVGVSGDIRDPLVVPLGPRAVGTEVLGIFERTLKLPVELVTPKEKQAPD